jgi:SAM-dependent MidA family methyltransferase
LNPLLQIISNDIRKIGFVTFERFMELALYCPEYGFYETEGDKIGRDGDFYTNVSVGSLFGELLAFQFSEWLKEILAVSSKFSHGGKIRIVEAGAYHGQLAGDILNWLQSWEPELLANLEYCLVEPSARLRSKQMDNLAEFSAKVRWVPDLSDFDTNGGIKGIVFSNELLDAMPVRRIGWDANQRRWFEWGVTLEAGNLVWIRISTPLELAVSELDAALLDVLPNDYTLEVASAANQWWQRAAELLVSGKLVAIDYGLTAEELITPERTGGTLRTYGKHRSGNDLLANVGELDITAHVNFTAIQAAGEKAGLRTENLFTQEKFLVQIAEKTWNRPEGFNEWTAARRRQLQTLVHPQHLGRPFRVFVQSR